jgi:hypothetical protein
MHLAIGDKNPVTQYAGYGVGFRAPVKFFPLVDKQLPVGIRTDSNGGLKAGERDFEHVSHVFMHTNE